MEVNESCIFPAEDALELILMFDRAGIVTYANTAAEVKLGYEGGLCGIHISKVFPGAFAQGEDRLETEFSFGKEVKKLAAYRGNRTCFPVEARILLQDKPEPEVQGHFRMSDRESGDFGIYICMAVDILEKEFLNREISQVKQEAQLALKVKSEFVANVTHELRTPVNGILGNIKVLLGEDFDKQTIRALQMMERCCGDMNKIIDNILDFSKLEAGKFTLEPRRFHFRNMLDYVRSNHINKLTEKGLAFFMTVSPRIPEYVIGDELRIVQVLGNLLSNAQKFTSVGKITVEAVLTAQVKDKIELFFMVKDTGIGIDIEDQDKLFQSFSQVDASISRKYGGTGLGLTICKQLVELMGGRIEVASEKKKGSTFSFSIWVGVSEEDESLLQPDHIDMPLDMAAFEDEAIEDARQFGTRENRKNLEKNLSKLILCVEMENWEKAEVFMDTVRQLTQEAPGEVRRMVLRLKMAVQKENYDRIMADFAELFRVLQIQGGG